MEAQTGVVNALLLLGEAQAAAAAAAAAGTPGGNAGNEFDLAESAYSDALLHLTQSFGMGLTSGGGGGGRGDGSGASGGGGGGGGGGFGGGQSRGGGHDCRGGHAAPTRPSSVSSRPTTSVSEAALLGRS